MINVPHPNSPNSISDLISMTELVVYLSLIIKLLASFHAAALRFRDRICGKRPRKWSTINGNNTKLKEYVARYGRFGTIKQTKKLHMSLRRAMTAWFPCCCLPPYLGHLSNFCAPQGVILPQNVMSRGENPPQPYRLMRRLGLT